MDLSSGSEGVPYGSTCSAREGVRRACNLLRRGVTRGVLRSMAATLPREDAGSRAARRACRACVTADTCSPAAYVGDAPRRRRRPPHHRAVAAHAPVQPQRAETHVAVCRSRARICKNGHERSPGRGVQGLLLWEAARQTGVRALSNSCMIRTGIRSACQSLAPPIACRLRRRAHDCLAMPLCVCVNVCVCACVYGVRA